jgi:NAD(P)-dependent dehydrogenase (short-subunit alcohol dehydrogenase family)
MAATTPWTAQQIPSQTGKTALVTGANSGIGYQAALELARHGAHVLLGCRNAAKGASCAAAKLLAEVPGAPAPRSWSWTWHRWRRSAHLRRRSPRAACLWTC